MTQEAVAYTWEIDGRRTLNPDVFYESAKANGFNLDREPLIQIDCPRGARAGKATLLFSKDDAAAIIALEGPQKITFRKWVQYVALDGTMSWNEEETHEFKDYYVLGAKNAFGVDENNKFVELADKRYLLENTRVCNGYNMVLSPGLDGTDYDRDSDTFFNDSIDDSDPYDYHGILSDLLSVLEGSWPIFLPTDDYQTPRNLVFNCSLADALDQMLATIGCVMIYDPLAEDDEDRFNVVEIDSEFDSKALDDAQSSGRLIDKTIYANCEKNRIPSKIAVRKNSLFHWQSGTTIPFVEPVEIEIEDADGDLTITLYDHEIEPDEDRVKKVVKDWYAVLSNPRDEIYQGIVKQLPACEITHVCWYFDSGATSTLIQNLLPYEIPWPKQFINATAPQYFGKITSQISPGAATGSFEIWDFITDTATGENINNIKNPWSTLAPLNTSKYCMISQCGKTGRYGISMEDC